MAVDASGFGGRIRSRRLDLGYTQAQLAQRAGCAEITLRKVEAGRRRPSAALARALLRALGVPAAEQADWLQPVAETVGDVSGLVGRHQDLTQVARLILANRLIVVTGPGGVGKTALAQALHRNETARGARAAFVDLVPAGTFEDALTAIAQALNLTFSSADDRLRWAELAKVLTSGVDLLILDNLEHLSAAAALIDRLLAVAPPLRILATSREPTRLPGEATWPVAPLPTVPEGEPISPQTLLAHDATRLYLLRAAEARPGFQPAEAEAAAIAELCRIVDGLPLAIELLATRVRLMSPMALLQRLTDGRPLRIDLIADGLTPLPARHHTLRDTIVWSVNLLSAEEQRAFAWLSVCSGGWTLEAAEAILGGDPVGVWNAVTRLVEAHLVRQTWRDDRARFDMFVAVREVGVDLLQARGDLDAAWSAHRRCYSQLAVHAYSALYGPDQFVWCDRVEIDRANLSLALERALAERDVAGAIELIRGLMVLWHLRDRAAEGQDVARRLGAMCLETPPSAAVASALNIAAMIAQSVGDFAEAREWFEATWKTLVQLNDNERMGITAANLAALCNEQGDPRSALAWLERSSTLLGEQGDRHTLALLEIGRITALAELGDIDAARRAQARGLDLARQAGDERLLMVAEGNGADIQLAAGDLDAVEATVGRLVAWAEAHEDTQAWLDAQLMLVQVALERRDTIRALTLVDVVAKRAAAARGRHRIARAQVWRAAVACQRRSWAEARRALADFEGFARPGDLGARALGERLGGEIALRNGELTIAATRLVDALAQARSLGLYRLQRDVLELLAELALRRGDAQQGVELRAERSALTPDTNRKGLPGSPA